MIYTILVFIFLTFSNALAQDSAGDDGSFAVENEETTIKIEKNGQEETTNQVWLTALNDKGRVDLSVRRITFDPSEIEMKVLEAALVQDGRTTIVPLSQISVKDVSSKENGISKMKSIEIPFPGVKTGGVIIYKTFSKRKIFDLAHSFKYLNAFGYLKVEKKGKTVIRSAIPLAIQSYDPEGDFQVTQTREGVYDVITVILAKTLHKIRESDLPKLSYDDIRFQVPRTQINYKTTWQELAKTEREKYDRLLDEPLPANIKTFLATLANLPKEKQVEKTFLWLAENMTYSGRWLAPNSGLNPRKISEILSGHAGDCKDFAILTLAFLKELKIKSDPVYVGLFTSENKSRFLQEPIDEAHPQPTLQYFNHVVVRYQSGNTWYTVDPGRNLGDSTRLPFYLNHKWSLVLNPDEQQATKLKANPENYGGAKSTITLRKKPDGNFSVTLQTEVSGELSNYMKSVYFGVGPNSLQELVPLFATVQPAAFFKTPPDLKLDRSAEPWSFTVTYSVNEEQIKVIPPYLDGMVASLKKSIHIPDFPVQVQQTIRIPESFVEHEETKDCMLRGPLISMDRKIENQSGTVVIEDRVNLPNAEAPTRTQEDKDRMGRHLVQIAECFKNIDLSFRKYEVGSPKQTSFESKIDTGRPYVEASSGKHGTSDEMTKIRTIDTYLKKNPNDLELLLKKGWAVHYLGIVTGDIYLKEYLEESNKIFQRVVEINPKDERGYANLGSMALLMQNETEAMDYFWKGYKINPRGGKILGLGAEISKKQKKFDTAIGYYAAAASATSDPIEKYRLLYSQASIQCIELKKCRESIPLVEQALALNPKDAWALYNSSIIYKRAKDYKKVIELNRRALEIMEFGLAKQMLVEALIFDTKPMIDKDRIETDDLPIAEKNLLEAYKIEPQNQFVLLGLVRIYSLRAFIEKKSNHFEAAEQYLNELKNAKASPKNVELAVRLVDMMNQSFGRKPASL